MHIYGVHDNIFEGNVIFLYEKLWSACHPFEEGNFESSLHDLKDKVFELYMYRHDLVPRFFKLFEW